MAGSLCLQWLELAWKEGFDVMGADQLGWSVRVSVSFLAVSLTAEVRYKEAPDDLKVIRCMLYAVWLASMFCTWIMSWSFANKNHGSKIVTSSGFARAPFAAP